MIRTEPGPRVLILGLDGAEPSLFFPGMLSGDLPHLAALAEAGASGPLESVFPAMTLPAWSTFLTGVGPGRHGILDFTRRKAGSYSLRFLTQKDRRVPTLFDSWSAAGRSVVSLLFPTTWPPNPVRGIQISGFDSPIATGMDGSFGWPRGILKRVHRNVGAIPFADFQELAIGPGWHKKARSSLLAAVERKEALALELLGDKAWDLFALLFGELDTASHHFWFVSDPHSPRFDADGAEELGDVIGEVYRRVDKAVGRIVEAGGFDLVCVASDHGFGGASRRVLYLNRLLEREGYLHFRGANPARSTRTRLVSAMPGLAQRAFRHTPQAIKGAWEGKARVGGLDLARTLAWSDELNYAPSVWIHQHPRDPMGPALEAHELASLEARLTDTLLGLRDPWDGGPVVEEVRPRREVLQGPASDGAPDLFLKLRCPGGYSWNVLPSEGPGPVMELMEAEQKAGAKGQGMNGSHRQDGIWILSGWGVQGGQQLRAQIADLAPTLGALAGLPQSDSDGRVLEEILEQGMAFRAGSVGGSLPWAQEGEGSDREVPSAEEEQAIADRLRSLGYLG